jgi:hypothetical protein
MKGKYVSICWSKSFAPNLMKKISPAMFLAMWLWVPSLKVAQDASKTKDLPPKNAETKAEFAKSAVPDYSKEPYVFELIQTKVLVLTFAVTSIDSLGGDT